MLRITGEKMKSELIRIFIGHDGVESAAYHTLCHSIMEHASRPVAITPIHLGNLRGIHDRERDPLQSNDFAFTRWLVPYLCNYQGHAIFMDPDMLVQDDIAKLWGLIDDQFAVQVVKHKHVPVEKTKFLGAPQTAYEKKNWSSVMLFNNKKCGALSPEYVNTASGLDLHQFKWLKSEGLIGSLPLRWNFLVDVYDPVDPSTVSNLHFTVGGPYFEQYKDCGYADIWWEDYFGMTFTQEAAPIPNKQLSGSEAVYGLLGWLTSRKEVTILSGSHDASAAAEAAKEFCEENNLDDPSESWADKLTHPKIGE